MLIFWDALLDTQRALVVWTVDPAERDAQLANEATKMLTASNYVLMEIGCTRSSYHLFKVRETYHLLYKKSLEEDVAHHTSGDYRKVSKFKFLSHSIDKCIPSGGCNHGLSCIGSSIIEFGFCGYGF